LPDVLLSDTFDANNNKKAHQMKRVLPQLLVVSIFLFSTKTSVSQDKPDFAVKASAELVNSYIWRGVPCYSYNNEQPVLAPNFQPTLGFQYGGFEVGAWGSTDFTGSYKEMDLYALYTHKGLTATFTDYYWDLGWLSKPYFSYNNETTSHILEGALTYKGTKIPFSLTVATMFYGADKKYEDSTKNNYSTYIEAGYTVKVKDYSFDTFIGMTPGDGLYGDGYGNVTGFAAVNIGVTGYKKIQLSEKYSTTLRSSLIFNPQQDKAYLVFGITF
jgi:hypothetical protein